MSDILEPDVVILDSESRKPDDRNTGELKPEKTSEAETPEAEAKESEAEGEQNEESAASEEEETGEEHSGEEDEDSAEAPKKSKGVQKRIDELTRQKHEALKREEQARQQAEYWRIQAQAEAKTKPAEKAKDQGLPKLEDFDSYDAFVQAQAEHAAARKFEELQQAERNRTESARIAQAHTAFQQKADAARQKYADFDQVALAGNVPITPVIGELLLESNVGADIAYHLGKNLDLAKQLSQMTPMAAAKEIGRLEIKLQQQPKSQPKKISSAPPPVKTVGGNERVSKDPSLMTNAEYRAWRTKTTRR